MPDTHQVLNQPPPVPEVNLWRADRWLRAIVEREGGGWVAERADALGAIVGSEAVQSLAEVANRELPVLRSHDRFGRRIDFVEYHPAYHALMAHAFGAGCHSLAWREARAGRFVARAALNYLWNQGEQGTACPVTMTFAGVHVVRNAPLLAREWEPALTALDYDPRPLPISQKRAATIGMAMTEKQGGSDLRANETRALPGADGLFELTGHKWFCSAPMSDAFLTLARSDAGLGCYLVPRSLPDGERNRIRIQRLKDKIGNRSNASSEIEYDGALAWPIGPAERGIATIIEMAHLTRFDIVIGCAAMMRAMLNQALHHTEYRAAFGRRLAEHALMQNVLADLALECEAAALLAFRLAGAFDREADAGERLIGRILTPIAKYWHCKRMPAVALEAMECLGGNGYVEEHPVARLYREAPVHGIWEGSGNVICLDLLRTFAKEPAALQALLAEIGNDAPLDAHVKFTLALAADTARIEANARRIIERLALALQASLMLRYAPPAASAAFVASRIAGAGERVFGTLDARTPFASIIERARLAN